MRTCQITFAPAVLTPTMERRAPPNPVWGGRTWAIMSRWLSGDQVMGPRVPPDENRLNVLPSARTRSRFLVRLLSTAVQRLSGDAIRAIGISVGGTTVTVTLGVAVNVDVAVVETTAVPVSVGVAVKVDVGVAVQVGVK